MTADILCHCGRPAMLLGDQQYFCLLPGGGCGHPVTMCTCPVIGVGVSLEFTTGPSDGLIYRRAWDWDEIPF